MKLKVQEQAYHSLDVLHVGYYLWIRHSIRKIIDNLISNCPSLHQNFFSFPEVAGKPKPSFDELGVIEFINRVRPKILHLHFSSIFDMALFDKLAYRPIVVCTVHGEVTNPYRDKIDVLVCVHQGGYEKNKGSRVVIEYTPDINPLLIASKPKLPKTACLATRFSFDCLSQKTIDLYGQIQAPLSVYGYSSGVAAAGTLFGWCAKKANLRVEKWTDYVETAMSKHDVFVYYPPEDYGLRCYDMKIMEAVTLGVPVITTLRHGSKEYITNGYNGFTVANESEFIEKSNLLLQNRDLFRVMKTNALSRAHSLTNDMHLHYSKLYTRLLSGRSIVDL